MPVAAATGPSRELFMMKTNLNRLFEATKSRAAARRILPTVACCLIAMAFASCAENYAGYPSPYPAYRGASYAYDAYPYGYRGYPGYPYYGAPFGNGYAGNGTSVVVRNDSVRSSSRHHRGSHRHHRMQHGVSADVNTETRAGVRERTVEPQ